MASDESEQSEQPANAPQTQKSKRARRRDDFDPRPGYTWDDFSDGRMKRRFRGGPNGYHTNGSSDQRATEKQYRGR